MSLRFQSYYLLYTDSVGRFGTKIHTKAEVRMGMIIFTNELGHKTNMATMPIYGKSHEKASSPEAINQ